MISKSKLSVISVVAFLLLSLSISLVGAQYTTSQTTNVTIDSHGTFTATASNVGVTYDIQGTPGATGTVTADVYNGNPQPTASIPRGDSLTHFIAIAFNMNASDFTKATINITYTSADVQNLQQPYAVFKYVASTNSYTKFLSTVDTNAKVITITLNSINDPVLAIGGTKSVSAGGISGAVWAAIIVVIIAVILIVVFIFSRRRSWAPIKVVDRNNQFSNSEQNTDLYPNAQPTNINMENKPQTVDSTERKIENQEMEFKDSANAESLSLMPQPEPAETKVEEEQRPLAAVPNADILPTETPHPQMETEEQQTSATVPNADILPKEIPQPQMETRSVQNSSPTAIQNNTKVTPPNANAQKKNNLAAAKKKRNKNKKPTR
ncbi:MAG: hypothetical protein ABSF44_08460 [Candidatus Bathyarchaeia archaeon]|jgi:hypothetical protein